MKSKSIPASMPMSASNATKSMRTSGRSTNTSKWITERELFLWYDKVYQSWAFIEFLQLDDSIIGNGDLSEHEKKGSQRRVSGMIWSFVNNRVKSTEKGKGLVEQNEIVSREVRALLSSSTDSVSSVSVIYCSIGYTLGYDRCDFSFGSNPGWRYCNHKRLAQAAIHIWSLHPSFNAEFCTTS